MDNLTKRVLAAFLPNIVNRSVTELVSEIVNRVRPSPILSHTLKSGTVRRFWQKAVLAVTLPLLSVLGALGIWAQSVDGAEISMAQVQQSESRILSPGGHSSATDLEAEARCDPMKLTATARLSWKLASPPGSQQRVDMTMFRDGFQTGKFTTTGPLPPDQTQLNLNSGEPGINYAWRVLTLTGEGWVPSETARLPWPSCPVDRRAPGGME